MDISEWITLKFDLGYLLTFFTGVVFGFTFLLLVYLYTLLKTMQSKRFTKKALEPDIDAEEIKLLIKDAQTQFKNKKKRDEIGLAPFLKGLISELSMDIAVKFYPESKYPLLELTIDETLQLGHYVTDRIDRIFSDSRMLKIFRSRTLSQLMSLYNVKTVVDESAIMKVEKKLKISKRVKEVVSAMNIVNPAYWIKKVTVDQLTQAIIVKMCLALIGIVGEETFKIYSKSVFDHEQTIDTGVESLYEDIQLNLEKEDKNESI